MRKIVLVAASAAVVLLAAAAATLVLLSSSSSQPFADPADARCEASPTFGPVRASRSHREVDVAFNCAGARIAGTLDLPRGGRGPYPAVVWVHGAGETARLRFEGTPLIQELVRAGIAVFSYDKRGVAESEGECCPGDYGQFNLLAADAAGAVDAIRARPEIDPARIGFLGASQAGWIVPLAAVRSGRVAFVSLVDAPAVSYAEEDLYSQTTGEQGTVLELASFVRTAGGLRAPGPAGFDPRPYLQQLEVPGLWLYGGADRSQPTADDVDVLQQLKADGRNFTVVVYPRVGHGLLDVPPSDPRALPQIVDWITRTTREDP
jgi:uncharacterized protein